MVYCCLQRHNSVHPYYTILHSPTCRLELPTRRAQSRGVNHPLPPPRSLATAQLNPAAASSPQPSTKQGRRHAHTHTHTSCCAARHAHPHRFADRAARAGFIRPHHGRAPVPPPGARTRSLRLGLRNDGSQHQDNSGSRDHSLLTQTSDSGASRDSASPSFHAPSFPLHSDAHPSP